MKDEELIVDPRIITRDEHTGLQAVEAEPDWRAMAWKHEELAKQSHYLADEIKRRDKARSEMASASEGIKRYGSTVAALRAELAELEASK